MFYGMTFAKLGWNNALLVAACGMVITFMMLGILACVIVVLSKIVASLEGKNKPAAAPAVAPAKKAAPAAAPAAPAAPAVDDGEMVAVMMAAIAEESGMPMSLEAIGYSNSRPVYDADGNPDMPASRRVSFRFMINLEQ